MGVHKRKDRPGTWAASWYEGGKQRRLSFPTEAEAEACLQSKLASRTAKPLLTETEKRKIGIERSGDNSALERRVAMTIRDACMASGVLDCIVLNDGTRADIAVKLRSAELYVGVQLKTTHGPMSPRQPNTWSFKHMHGYEGMLVVCWRDDHSDGWLRRGNDAGPDTFNPTLPKSKSKPLQVNELVSGIAELLGTSHGLEEHTEEYLRWELKAPGSVTEMLTISTYRQWASTNCMFPVEQNGAYDLVEDGTLRLQFKHCRANWKRGNGKTTGFEMHLSKKAGTVSGKKTRRPYAVGDFDALVAGHIDHSHKLMFTWKIPASKLEEYFETDDHPGLKCVTVHPPEAVRRTYGLGLAPCNSSKSRWTASYFVGALPLATMSEDAKRACGVSS